MIATSVGYTHCAFCASTPPPSKLPRSRVKTAIVAVLILVLALSFAIKFRVTNSNQASDARETVGPGELGTRADSSSVRPSPSRAVRREAQKNDALVERKQPAKADPIVAPDTAGGGGLAPRHFYASGHRVDLVEDRGWAAVKLTAGAKMAEVKTALRAELGSPAETEGNFNEMTGIVAERVTGAAGEAPTEEEAKQARGRANRLAGVGRVMRVWMRWLISSGTAAARHESGERFHTSASTGSGTRPREHSMSRAYSSGFPSFTCSPCRAAMLEMPHHALTPPDFWMATRHQQCHMTAATHANEIDAVSVDGQSAALRKY